LSNVRSMRLAEGRIFIGKEAVNRQALQEAEQLLQSRHPDLKVTTTADGKRQISLPDILLLEKTHRQEKEAAEKAAYDSGREAGYSAGLEKGREEARKVVASLSKALSDITGQRDAILQEAREKIFELVLKISERLTFSAAAIDPDVTMSIINGAIDQLLDKSKLKVKVHPNHLPEVEQHIDRFRGADTKIKEFILEADPRVRAGGCFIETPAGDIDARLDSMYEVIKQSILDGKGSVQ
jgi:flagellar assembly protein FliH